ncbi:hypothetical protein F5Y16DRAFT_377476 [Xylariaceae sp. FL0255]|nr:hypothetical protein F5Y16DRAFT_377476 [Xylariaceae sp. FL0255]
MWAFLRLAPILITPIIVPIISLDYSCFPVSQSFYFLTPFTQTSLLAHPKTSPSSIALTLLRSPQGPAPTESDCDTVIDQVYNINESLAIQAGSCLLFEYNTCWGFFCSLCTELSTTTDFIGNQLSTAETLCVQGGGDGGTLVGEDSPQWEGGLIYEGDSLPDYNVC